MKYNITDCHISEIRPGDCILCNDGEIRTIGAKDIKKSFIGITIFGDSYKCGHQPVKKINIYRAR